LSVFLCNDDERVDDNDGGEMRGIVVDLIDSSITAVILLPTCVICSDIE